MAIWPVVAASEFRRVVNGSLTLIAWFILCLVGRAVTVEAEATGAETKYAVRI